MARMGQSPSGVWHPALAVILSLAFVSGKRLRPIGNVSDGWAAEDILSAVEAHRQARTGSSGVWGTTDHVPTLPVSAAHAIFPGLCPDNIDRPPAIELDMELSSKEKHLLDRIRVKGPKAFGGRNVAWHDANGTENSLKFVGRLRDGELYWTAWLKGQSESGGFAPLRGKADVLLAYAFGLGHADVVPLKRLLTLKITKLLQALDFDPQEEELTTLDPPVQPGHAGVFLLLQGPEDFIEADDPTWWHLDNQGDTPYFGGRVTWPLAGYGTVYGSPSFWSPDKQAAIEDVVLKNGRRVSSGGWQQRGHRDRVIGQALEGSAVMTRASHALLQLGKGRGTLLHRRPALYDESLGESAGHLVATLKHGRALLMVETRTVNPRTLTEGPHSTFQIPDQVAIHSRL